MSTNKHLISKLVVDIVRLTLWGRVTHICVSKLTIIVSDNGLPPVRRQAIIWNNAGILLIGPLGTNLSEILIGIRTFSLKKMHLKMSSAKWRPLCLGLNVLKIWLGSACFVLVSTLIWLVREHMLTKYNQIWAFLIGKYVSLTYFSWHIRIIQTNRAKTLYMYMHVWKITGRNIMYIDATIWCVVWFRGNCRWKITGVNFQWTQYENRCWIFIQLIHWTMSVASWNFRNHKLHHVYHDDVIKWKYFPRYWPFMRGIHRSPVMNFVSN